jgi:hypothetical protein
MADDLYDISKYTDKQLYDILDMNNPTDRELEAKIIHLIKKYENMQNESGDQLALFFHRIYDRFFNTDNSIEGFQNPTPDPSKTMDPSKFALSDDESAVALKNTLLTQSSPTISPNDITTPQTRQIGYEPQQISSVQQFDYSPDKLQLNPLLKQTIKRIISIDSQYRDIKTNPLTTSFSFDLSEPLRDVVSLKLYSVQIPYTWYTIPKSYGSNFFYLKGATSGINDGNHDYKIEIKPGNYTPADLESAINQRFYDISNNTPNQMTMYMERDNLSGISSASDVNFNGTPKLITYTPNTSKMTMNIDLQKVYTEAYYKLYFPNWSSPVTNPTASIPGYMGLNHDIYYLCSVSSDEAKYTSSSINTQVTQDYFLNNSNNYFTVNVYSNTSLVKTYKIVLQNNGLEYTGLASRTQIYSSINTTLQNYKDIITGENVFEAASGIEAIDITGNKPNTGNRYYRLTIILNRYIVKYVENTNVEVIFPIETPTETNNFTIWVDSTSINAFHKAFFFKTHINPLYEFTSESPAVFSSYIVDTSTNIILTCKKNGYVFEVNDISLNIPSNPSYTLTGLTNAITQSFVNNSNKTPSNILFYTDSTITETKGAYIDPITQKFTLTVDLEKKFTTQHYHIKWDNTSLLYNIEGIEDPGDNVWSEDGDLSSILSANIFTHKINSRSSYSVDKTLIFTITPNKTITNPGNRDAEPVDVFLTSQLGSFSIQGYITAINTSINTYPALSGSRLDATYNSERKQYDLSLNISYNYSLTERDYDISFVDYNYNITSDNNIWKKFSINSKYDLSLNDYYNDSSGAYAVIKGASSISGDEIQVVDGSNTIILQTNSLSQYNIPNNTIILTIPVAKYTIDALCLAINTQINKYPMLYGSQILQVTKDSSVYTKIKIIINNIYTSKDYNIVFYDPFSFAKCYSGSRSVQNTTWDSTLGWILGYRDYTQYLLVSGNKVSNGSTSYYYLTSQNGSYTYSETNNIISNLLTNIEITLEGDTTVSTNLYNYFLISLDDYIQNHLNDGLVTITRKETALSIPDYSYAVTQICDPITNTLVSTSTQQSNSDNVTNKQLYSLNQSIYSQQNTLKTYSPGPFIKDLFGFIPIKPPSKNGDYYIEFGGSLQNQERLYFGPVNIRKMTIQLLNDRGDVVDLNNTNWSFSFICEQLYRASSS